MFYFTCNESKIYESFTFEISYKKNELFHDILIYEMQLYIIFILGHLIYLSIICDFLLHYFTVVFEVPA